MFLQPRDLRGNLLYLAGAILLMKNKSNKVNMLMHNTAKYKTWEPISVKSAARWHQMKTAQAQTLSFLLEMSIFTPK